MSLQFVIRFNPSAPASIHNQSIRVYTRDDSDKAGSGFRQRLNGASLSSTLQVHQDLLLSVLIIANAMYTHYEKVPVGLRRYLSLRRASRLVSEQYDVDTIDILNDTMDIRFADKGSNGSTFEAGVWRKYQTSEFLGQGVMITKGFGAIHDSIVNLL